MRFSTLLLLVLGLFAGLAFHDGAYHAGACFVLTALAVFCFTIACAREDRRESGLGTRDIRGKK